MEVVNMFLNSKEFSKMVSLINIPDHYSRVNAFEIQFNHLTMEELTSNPLVVYIGLWMYSEYFAEHPNDFDEGRAGVIKSFVKALKGTAFDNAVPQDPMLFCHDGGASFCLPHLSAKAWDFLHQHCEGVTYWNIQDNKLHASAAGMSRWSACRTPQEISAFWEFAIRHPKIVDDSLSSKDLGKMGLSDIFKHVYLDALGVRTTFTTADKSALAEHTKNLWGALHTAHFQLGGLKRLFLKEMIEQITDEDQLMTALHACLESNIATFTEHSFIDLAMVCDIGKLKKYVGNDQEKWGKVIASWLDENCSFSKEDKHLLLKQAGSFLTSDQLKLLANQYAQSDWGMMRALKHEAFTCQAFERSTLFFNDLEKSSTQKHKATWPKCFNTLEKLISQIEAAYKPSTSRVAQLASSASNYVMPVLASRLPTSVTEQFGAVTPAIKDLNPLLRGETISLSEKTTISAMTRLFVDAYKMFYPQATQIGLDDLPWELQQKLEKLKPQFDETLKVDEEAKKSTALALID